MDQRYWNSSCSPQNLLGFIFHASRFAALMATYDIEATRWSFVDGKTIDQTFDQLSDYPTHTAESDALAKDLKKRGFKFMGTTVCYAYMQAVGLVNDHQKNCFKRKV